MDIQTAISNRLNYYKQQCNIIKAHQTKAALISLRKDWIVRQNKTNYRNEYDRIRGILENSVLPGTTKEHLQTNCEELGGKGASKTFDNMF